MDEARREKLRSDVRDHILEGLTDKEIVARIIRRQPNMSKATIKRWIAEIVEQISVTQSEAKTNKPLYLGLAIARYHDLYKKAMDLNDLKLAADINQRLSKLQGLEPSASTKIKVDNRRISVENVNSGNLPAPVDQLPTKELMKIAGVSEPPKQTQVEVEPIDAEYTLNDEDEEEGTEGAGSEV